VQINFLVVGHTHEDIDQFFSKISKKIKMSGCESLQGLYLCVALLLLCIFALDLMKRIQESCKARPVCQILDGVWDFKDWMKPFLGKIENHSKYHAFKFSKRLSSMVYCIHMFICLFRI